MPRCCATLIPLYAAGRFAARLPRHLFSLLIFAAAAAAADIYQPMPPLDHSCPAMPLPRHLPLNACRLHAMRAIAAATPMSRCH